MAARTVVFCDFQTSIFNKQDQISFSYIPVNMAHDASSILLPIGDFFPHVLFVESP